MSNQKEAEKSTTISLPPGLAKQIQTYIQSGWAPDLNTLVIEAVRRYLDTHETDL